MPRVSTIDKCWDILEALLQAERQGLGARALARQLEMNVTSVHNMCRTLCDRDYVWQDPQSKRFQLGAGLALFAHSGHVWQRMAADAEPIVQRCQQELDESILLATIRSSDMITLTYLPSSQALRVHEPHTMGERAYGTAVGKVLLSALARDDFERYVLRFPPQSFTVNTLVASDRLEAELDLVRNRGYGHTCDELTLGVSAVAVPIVGPHGRCFAALGASAPTVRMDRAGIEQARQVLADCAQQIEGIWFPN